jgi:hypothetical protein
MTLDEINALEGGALDREVAVTVLGLVPGPRVGADPTRDAPEARLWYDPARNTFLTETTPPVSSDPVWLARVIAATGIDSVGLDGPQVCRAALALGVTE